METENKNQSEFKKKKKKRSFLQQAKKFGKQGRFGKGQDIDANTYNYFVQVLSNLDKNDFEDEESRGI
jgi:nucleolar protein 9